METLASCIFQKLQFSRDRNTLGYVPKSCLVLLENISQPVFFSLETEVLNEHSGLFIVLKMAGSKRERTQ